VTFAPSICYGAAWPNIWQDIGYDTWPKPGSLAVNTAPAWYTWAYTDSAATTSRPAYSFGSTITPSASGRSLSRALEPGATVTYAFTGDTLGWLYAAGPFGGTATLTVDGDPGKTRTVDQYAPAISYGRRFDLTGFGAGPHTVVVESDAALYHDAFVAPTDAADRIPLAEDHSDGATRYAWARAAAGFASGSSYSYAADRDAATAFTFSGTSVTWHYARRPDGGLAQVWVDGVDKGTVDQYGRRGKRRGAPLAGSVTYTGLGGGTHTILVVNTGERSADSSGTVVSSDAFVVGGVTFED
jgi:bacillopeptidase F